MTFLQILSFISPVPIQRERPKRDLDTHFRRVEKAFDELAKSVEKKEKSNTQMLEAIQLNSAAQCQMSEISREYIEVQRKISHG